MLPLTQNVKYLVLDLKNSFKINFSLNFNIIILCVVSSYFTLHYITMILRNPTIFMHPLPKNLVSYLSKLRISVHQFIYCYPAIPKEIDFVSTAKLLLKMKHNFYLIVLLYIINMWGKNYSKSLLIYFIHIALYLTWSYIRD